MSTPKMIGERYRLEEKIGEGGMGIVFRGMDTLTQDEVAIKVLKAERVAEDRQYLKRFRDEAELLRQLDHPNIVRILDTITEDGDEYIVMEYVQGGSLQEILTSDKPLSLQAILNTALELADALSRAHHLGVIHRDIKPGNVLISTDRTPRLTDFGVARGQSTTRVTEVGTIVGTLNYLVPELFDNHPASYASDIWAFGIVLYQMVTQQHPFGGESEASVLNQILSAPVPDIQNLRPDVPPALSQLIQAMLEKSPEKRIGSMRSVAAQLEEILRDIQTSPIDQSNLKHDLPLPQNKEKTDSPPHFVTNAATTLASTDEVVASTHSPEKRKRQTRRPIQVAVGIIILITVVGVGAFLLLSQNAEPITVDCDIPPDEYMVMVAEFESVGNIERDAARFIIEDLKENLEEGLPFIPLSVCRYPAVISNDDEALEIATTHGASVIIWGNYDANVIEANIQIGDLSRFPNISMDRSTLERVANVRVHLTDERTESLVGSVMAVWVTEQNADGNGYGAARAVAAVALLDAEYGEIIGQNPAAYGHRYFTNYTRDSEYALEAVSEAIDLEPNPIAYVSRAAIRVLLGETDKAILDAETAARLGPDNWTTPAFVIANLALADQDYDQALETYSEIIEQRPDEWFPYSMRGGIHYLNGEYERAKTDFEASIAREPTENFPYLLRLIIEFREGRILDAQQTVNTILQEYPDPSFGNRIVESTFGEESSIIFAPMFSAFGNMILGQYDEVLANTETLLENDQQFADVYLLRGFAYCNLRDYEAAIEAYDQAIELDPTFTALYLLRAEAKVREGSLLAAAGDAGYVLQNDTSGQWGPVLQASQAGDLNCENLLTFDMSQLLDDE